MKSSMNPSLELINFDLEFLVKYPSYLKCDRNFPLFWYLFI